MKPIKRDGKEIKSQINIIDLKPDLNKDLNLNNSFDSLHKRTPDIDLPTGSMQGYFDTQLKKGEAFAAVTKEFFNKVERVVGGTYYQSNMIRYYSDIKDVIEMFNSDKLVPNKEDYIIIKYEKLKLGSAWKLLEVVSKEKLEKIMTLV